MASRNLAGSQYIPKEIYEEPNIKYILNGDPGIRVQLKLTGYRPNDFNRDLNRAMKQANQIISDRLGQALDKAMLSSAWSSGNDIVDTGELKNSLTIITTAGGISLNYSAPYAALVHYGGYITPYGNQKLEKVYIAGRPWVDSVIKGGGPVPRFNFEDIYREAIKSVFG
jgi:phage gpG-like protein